VRSGIRGIRGRGKREGAETKKLTGRGGKQGGRKGRGWEKRSEREVRRVGSRGAV